ncbi:hypothetical protein DLP3_058 [Stenotrophomonas phage vB_SmaS_DLP_3]|nr:hypothetical protein DLP3_058 [Stenotrophomonas phage vB_SmaS_DLP_3]
MGLENNPLMKRLAKHSGTAHGDTSERRVAKSLGARLQPNSGAMRGAKGDATLSRNRKFRVECKSTVKNALPIELAWLVKIHHEALTGGEVPILTVSFVTPDGKSRPPGDWVMMPKTYFDELTED